MNIGMDSLSEGKRHISFRTNNLEPMARLWMGSVPNNSAMLILALELGLAKPGATGFELVTYQVHMTGLPTDDTTDLRWDPATNTLQKAAGEILYTNPVVASASGVVLSNEIGYMRLGYNPSEERDVNFRYADLLRSIRQIMQKDWEYRREPNLEELYNIYENEVSNLDPGELNYGLALFTDDQIQQMRQIIELLITSSEVLSPRLATELEADLALVGMRSTLAYVSILRLTGLYKILEGWKDLEKEDLMEINKEIVSRCSTSKVENSLQAMTIEYDQEKLIQKPLLEIDEHTNQPVLEFTRRKNGMEIINEILEEKRREKGLAVLADGYASIYRWLRYNRPIHAPLEYAGIKV